MADLLATLFRFRQFVFEYGPFFLAAWFAVASATGVIAVARGRWVNFETSKWQLLFLLLWRPSGKMPTPSTFSGLLFFSLAASVPALVVTSLIGGEAVWLRLGLAAPFALFLSWFVTAVVSRKQGNFREQPPEGVWVVSQSCASNGGSSGLRSLAQVTWKSFIGQAEGAVIPLVIGFILASVLIIYLPAYMVRPWLGSSVWWAPYLAALAMPFQLTGGAEVLLASALLVKGASLGAALSVMLVAPSTTFYMIRHLYRPLKVKAIALYLVATWFVAGSLGVAVDGIQRLLSG